MVFEQKVGNSIKDSGGYPQLTEYVSLRNLVDPISTIPTPTHTFPAIISIQKNSEIDIYRYNHVWGLKPSRSLPHNNAIK